MSSTTNLIPFPRSDLDEQRARIRASALSGLSENSRRAYGRQIDRFLLWLEHNSLAVSREHVLAYLGTFSPTTGAQTYNQAVAAIKRLASEAAANGWCEYESALRIQQIKSRPYRGQRLGNWLTRDQVRTVLSLPDRATMKGQRDYCLLCLLFGAGLRRSEAAQLTIEQIQSRDGRTMIVDLEGKGRKIRSITLSEFVVIAIREWVGAAGIKSGFILRSMKGEKWK